MRSCSLQAYNIVGLSLLSSSLECKKSQQIVDQLKEKQSFVCEFLSLSGLPEDLKSSLPTVEEIEAELEDLE
ncbi:MAG TPA: hypothetical protein P5107_03620 [Thermotogota bacterium]|nr:hypothetical protein [Thermotogota bacterium]